MSQASGQPTSLDQQLDTLKRRLLREAMMVVEMLEQSLAALFELNTDIAHDIRRRDDRIDAEEVAIEQACYRLLTLTQPVAKDFRLIAFTLKVNADFERIADHAVSIAKITEALGKLNTDRTTARWPTALIELAERVPMACHELLRSVLDESADKSRQLIAEDRVLDRLDKQVFRECVELMDKQIIGSETGMLIHRLSRELERVGDLLVNVAEDVVFLATGEIVRHAAKKKRRQAEAG